MATTCRIDKVESDPIFLDKSCDQQKYIFRYRNI